MTLLTMSLSAGVMIAVIAILRALLINRLPKITFFLLWAVVLLRLLVPYDLPFSASIYSWLDFLEQPKQESFQQLPPSVSLSADTASVQEAQSFDQILPLEQPTRQLSQETVLLQGENRPLKLDISWLWALGAAILACYFAIGYIRGVRKFAASLPVENPFCARWLDLQRKQLPLRRKICIRKFDQISGPLTYGVLRPTILLPNEALSQPTSTLHYVLTHEYVHIRRFDCVSKLLLSAALCLHWFNPLVWVMYVLANRDLELSCDEMVLRLLGIENRSAYAMALLEMEEKRSGFGALYSAFGKNAIEERIGAIMKMKKGSLLSAVMAVVLVFTLTACLATSPVEEETSAPAAEEKDIIESETVSVTSELTEKEKNQIGWEYNRKWLLWDYTAYGFTYNEETEKWQYQGLDVHAFLDPEKDVHLINDEPGLSFLATYDENGKLNIQRIDRETAGKLYIEYFGSPILYDNRIDLYKDNPDTIFVGQWEESVKQFRATRYVDFGMTMDTRSHLLYNGELVRYFIDGVTYDFHDGDCMLDRDLADRQSERCAYLYEYYNPEGTVDLYAVYAEQEREDSNPRGLGNLIGIEEFEPSVLEGKQFQLVDIKEREELNRKVENLSWDDMMEKLSALEAQGITYETIGEGIQMYYNDYPVTRLTYTDGQMLDSFVFTSVNPPEPNEASISMSVNVRPDGEVRIKEGMPFSGVLARYGEYGILYDEEKGAWVYRDQVIRYFIDGVNGQFPLLLRDDGEISLKVNYNANHYISGLETIPGEQAQALWEQAEAADGQTGQTEENEQPAETQQQEISL